MDLRRLALIFVIAIQCARAELFVSNHDSGQIFRFNELTLDFIDVFIPNADGRLLNPHGIAFGPDGNLYIASAGNDRVLRYNSQTGAYIDDFVTAGSGGLDYPVALIFRGTNLYVSSQLSNRVLRYNAANGAFIDTFVTPSAALDGPSDMAFGPDGRLYVVGRFSNTVVRYDGRTGAYVDTFINSKVNSPFGLRFFDSGVLIIASGNDNLVQSFNELEGNNPPGDFVSSYITNNLSHPIGIVLAPHFVVVANYGGNSLCVFDGQQTRLVTAPAPGLRGPDFMAFRPSPRPTFSFKQVGDQLELSWPNDPSTDFHVITSTEIFDDHDGPIGSSAPPIPVNGTNTVTYSISQPRAFFRLKKEY